MVWWAAGTFLTGESPNLSPRVKRDLPQSLLGRVFLSWFAPGPGTGYMFAVAAMIAMTLTALLPFNWFAEQFHLVRLPPAIVNAAGTTTITGGVVLRATRPQVLECAIIATAYVTIYLGLAKLIMWGISRFGEVKLSTRLTVNLVLLMTGVLVPWSIQLATPSMRDWGYSLLQIPNPVWTLYECCFKGIPLVGPLLPWSLSIAAICVFVANLPGLAEEVRRAAHRQAPARRRGRRRAGPRSRRRPPADEPLGRAVSRLAVANDGRVTWPKARNAPA